MTCRQLQSAGQAHKSRICSSAGQRPLPQQLFTTSVKLRKGEFLLSQMCGLWFTLLKSQELLLPSGENVLILRKMLYNTCSVGGVFLFWKPFPKKNNIETILCINAQSIAQACVTGNFPVSSPVPQSHCCL